MEEVATAIGVGIRSLQASFKRVRAESPREVIMKRPVGAYAADAADGQSGCAHRSTPLRSNLRSTELLDGFNPARSKYCPRLVHSLWKPKEIYVTENGCAASDIVAADGQVFDSDRLMYLRNGMTWQRATAEGVPLKGSFYSETPVTWRGDGIGWFTPWHCRLGLHLWHEQPPSRTVS